MLDETTRRGLTVKLEGIISKFLSNQSENDVDLPFNDDLLSTRMADAAMLVLVHSDEVQEWLRDQGYLKDEA